MNNYSISSENNHEDTVNTSTGPQILNQHAPPSLISHSLNGIFPPPPYKHFSKVELDKPRPEDISPSLISLLRALVLPLKQKVPPQSHFRLTTYSLPITRVKWGRDR